jgi:hypothetical protein
MAQRYFRRPRYKSGSSAVRMTAFSFDALTVISKDAQDSVLEALRQDAGIPVKRVTTIGELTTRDGFPFYLPLGDVIHDLEEMGDQLDSLLQQTRTADLARRDSQADDSE